MYLVCGISGSKAADMAAIPPSLVLIAIRSSAGVSIAGLFTGLFTGGLLPAVVGALALIVIVRLRSKRGDRLSERPSGRAIGRSFLVALPALALPPEWMVAGDVEAGRLERCVPALRAYPAG